MILVENRDFLRVYNRTLLDIMKKKEVENSNSTAFVEISKSLVPTLKINLNSKIQYIHSKYDPLKECEIMVDKIDNIEKYNHILFYGLGLGYHIETFVKNNPKVKYSIFEPNQDVLYKFFSTRKISDFNLNNLIGIFTGTTDKDIKKSIYVLSEITSGNILFYSLPTYEKLYFTEISLTKDYLKKNLIDKRSNISTTSAFQKRWTINSIKNFPTLLSTPNALHDIDKSYFKGKPVILAAAGPSLSDEISNLRYIKESRKAIIFAVGSAVNALIEEDIIPDAVCSYDPTEKNYLVLEKLKERNISLPLIFGSSVGFETLYNYPGPMCHMITSQDPVAPKLLDTSKEIDIVLDAPSIAVITFQLLIKLEVGKIIFVGQNLSYKNNNRYAAGINYSYIKNEITEEEISEALWVRGVDGNEVMTNEVFNRMRRQLEMYIYNSREKEVDIINTTKGGAHIEGAKFINLSDLISTQLKQELLISNDWVQTKNNYNYNFVKTQVSRLKNEYVQYRKIYKIISKNILDIQTEVNKGGLIKLNYLFNKFDKNFISLKENKFFQGFIEPMLRVQYKRLSDKTELIQVEKDLIIKGESIIKEFDLFLQECNVHSQFIYPYFREMGIKVYDTYNVQSK